MATAVSSAGVVGVLWIERAASGSRACRDVYFSASFDGGATFSSAERVSSSASCPNAKMNGPSATFGDYFGLAADPQGRFRAAWADARTGLFQLRTALIDVGVTPIANERGSARLYGRRRLSMRIIQAGSSEILSTEQHAGESPSIS